MRIKIYAFFNFILLFLAGATNVFAQETGTSGSTGGGASSSTSVESSSRTSTSSEEVVTGMDTNTMLLIGLAALAFIILLVALSRRNKTEVTKTVINDRRV
jgi:hypothetical protein